MGGCDEVEASCYNDIHMLDTQYMDGMRWRKLPVGLQRPQVQSISNLPIPPTHTASHQPFPTHFLRRPHTHPTPTLQARQHFTVWAHGERVFLQGGCAPALAAVGGDEHCFSDLWSLDLGNLLATGAKGFNVSANGTMVASSELARDDASTEVYGSKVSSPPRRRTLQDFAVPYLTNNHHHR